jgi:tetratricopeptide (TPR) repeat protein
MPNLFKELRRREVFRTAGLYVGIAWIVIEGASVLLPAFEAPDWVMRAIIIVAIIGLPVAVVLAWVFDITDKGIEVQGDATDTIVAPFGGRKMDFVVIGVLSVALIFSVYLNISSKGSGVAEEIEPTSVLITDFDNQTGDPLFDGTIEQTISIGVESAPFITAFDRNRARSSVKLLSGRFGDSLNENAGRLIAVREGVQLVLSGTVSESGGRYEFNINVVEPASGERVMKVNRTAADKVAVLGTVSEIAGAIREELGDTSPKEETLRGRESFTAGSLEAAKAYTEAQNIAYTGDYEEAAKYYRQAIEYDPEFGRAYSGWALAMFNVGRDAEAEELWQKALTYMDTMTDRERYRTLGLYYMAVSQNYEKAIESYEDLVAKYPADGAGHNNLAVAYFSTLDFAGAMDEARAVLKIYPNNLFYQQNYALFAMYAGEFDLAEKTARAVVAADESRYYPWLPIAIAQLSRGRLDAARDSYKSMAGTGERGASLANLGLADIALFEGQYRQAVDLLETGVDIDIESGDNRSVATKYIALAEAHAGAGDVDASITAIENAIDSNAGLGRQVAAALLYLEHGRLERAIQISDELLAAVQPQRRAYGEMIGGLVEELSGNSIAALDRLRAAQDLADFWLVRFYLGQAYLNVGSYVEALDEFEIAAQRRGEASALFQDDLPTWRYVATLPYWQGRAQEALGMSEAAMESYTEFLERRAGEDLLALDARERIAR